MLKGGLHAVWVKERGEGEGEEGDREERETGRRRRESVSCCYVWENFRLENRRKWIFFPPGRRTCTGTSFLFHFLLWMYFCFRSVLLSVCLHLSVCVICFVLVLFLLLWNLLSKMKLPIYPNDKLSGKSAKQKSIASAGSAIARFCLRRHVPEHVLCLDRLSG